MNRVVKLASIVAVLAILLTGCGMQFPADPHGTLARVQDGVMRVGVTENAPWVQLDDEGAPSGTEPALIAEFAAQYNADVEWTAGSEATLLDALDRGELDMVIGGFLDDTPWSEFGAVTRPYVETTNGDEQEKHVMIVRMGENAFLVALEGFLDGRSSS